MDKKIFLGRQNIYDRNMNVVAYELLYRNSYENFYNNNCDKDNITCELLNNAKEIGVEKVRNNKKILVNFSYDNLKESNKLCLDPKYFVIEILEDVKPTRELMKIISNLKKSGYLIALDDVVDNNIDKFEKYIDIYKIDFLDTKQIERRKIINKIREVNKDAKILAEKVATKSELEEAKKMNYDYYQGFFLHTTEIVTS